MSERQSNLELYGRQECHYAKLPLQFHEITESPCPLETPTWPSVNLKWLKHPYASLVQCQRRLGQHTLETWWWFGDLMLKEGHFCASFYPPAVALSPSNVTRRAKKPPRVNNDQPDRWYTCKRSPNQSRHVLSLPYTCKQDRGYTSLGFKSYVIPCFVYADELSLSCSCL